MAGSLSRLSRARLKVCQQHHDHGAIHNNCRMTAAVVVAAAKAVVAGLQGWTPGKACLPSCPPASPRSCYPTLRFRLPVLFCACLPAHPEHLQVRLPPRLPDSLPAHPPRRWLWATIPPCAPACLSACLPVCPPCAPSRLPTLPPPMQTWSCRGWGLGGTTPIPRPPPPPLAAAGPLPMLALPLCPLLAHSPAEPSPPAASAAAMLAALAQATSLTCAPGSAAAEGAASAAAPPLAATRAPAAC